MGEISRARLLQVVGGLLGIAAFFLPWVASNFGAAMLSLTSTDLIVTTIQYFLGGEPLLGGFGGDALTAGLVVVTVGVLLLLASSAITLISPYGGPLMFVASAISVSGITVMSVAIVSIPVFLRFTVGYGTIVAFSGANIAIKGQLYHRASLGDQKSKTPPTEGEQG